MVGSKCHLSAGKKHQAKERAEKNRKELKGPAGPVVNGTADGADGVAALPTKWI